MATKSQRAPRRTEALSRDVIVTAAAEILDAEGAEAAIERVKPKVVELCRRFPVYGS